MAHSKEAHAKMNGMGNFNKGHWTQDQGDTEVADGKYTSGEMDNPKHMKESVNKLSSYVKKNRMAYP